MRGRSWLLVGLVAAGMLTSGCSTKKYTKQISDQEARIAELEQQIDELQGQVQEEQAKAAEIRRELEEALADYKAREQVWLSEKDAMAIVTVSDAVLFASGDADLTPDGREFVDRIAEVASRHSDRAILIEGHTDDVPIGEILKDRYPSNWELSSARACSVLRYLQWHHNLDPARMSAIGYGQYKPLADNETPEGRAQNRRVVIAIGPIK